MNARDRRHRLLDAVRTAGPGHRWTTRQVLDLYAFTDPGIVQRHTVRRDLAALHQAGHLTQHGPEDSRYYTLRTQKDGV